MLDIKYFSQSFTHYILIHCQGPKYSTYPQSNSSSTHEPIPWSSSIASRTTDGQWIPATRLLLYRPRLPFPIIIFIEIIITFRQYDGEQSKSGNSNLTVGVSILTGRPPSIHPFVRPSWYSPLHPTTSNSSISRNRRRSTNLIYLNNK